MGGLVKVFNLDSGRRGHLLIQNPNPCVLTPPLKAANFPISNHTLFGAWGSCMFSLGPLIFLHLTQKLESTLGQNEEGSLVEQGRSCGPLSHHTVARGHLLPGMLRGLRFQDHQGLCTIGGKTLQSPAAQTQGLFWVRHGGTRLQRQYFGG